MKLLEVEDFSKLCFGILRKYQDKEEYFKTYCDKNGRIYILELVENPYKAAHDIQQMAIIIKIYNEIQYIDKSLKKPMYPISKLIDLLESNSNILMHIVTKREKVFSPKEAICRLFDKFILVKAEKPYFLDFLTTPFPDFVVYGGKFSLSFIASRFYLLDAAEVVKYLL
ncbi:MAG: hypothetical protein DRM98_03570 [Thermoplasmata archaeon]|nr:MAG: hypothetical protein DRM98_03570 [Thermoplasmata archaeon]